MVTNTDLVGNRDSWIANASTISHGALGAAGGDFTVLAGGALSVLGSTGTAGGQKVGQRSDVQGRIPIAGVWKPPAATRAMRLRGSRSADRPSRVPYLVAGVIETYELRVTPVNADGS